MYGMKNIFDCHNHCQFSFDGKRTTVEESARAARAKGLGGIAFTDHYDMFVPNSPEEDEPVSAQTFDIPGQQEEIDRVQALFGDSLKIPGRKCLRS